MPVSIQNPRAAGSGDLVEAIARHCEGMTEGAAAFAFATLDGIQMLAENSAFRSFLGRASFQLIIGLDAITDTAAVRALAELERAHSGVEARLFVHSRANACFHPKMLWLGQPGGGGIALTGSGNLTRGGLRSNWEAFAAERLDAPALDQMRQTWLTWVARHEGHLRQPGDPEVERLAARNGAFRNRVRRAARSADEVPPLEALPELREELRRDRILIAEVPRNGDRLGQVNFNFETFQGYFGATPGVVRFVDLQHVTADRVAASPVPVQAVAVKSHNYRFEVAAIRRLPYPENGHPILVFRQLSDDLFRYVLLMPDEDGHREVQGFLDQFRRRGNRKRRLIVTVGDLEAAWPECPLLD